MNSDEHKTLILSSKNFLPFETIYYFCLYCIKKIKESRVWDEEVILGYHITVKDEDLNFIPLVLYALRQSQQGTICKQEQDLAGSQYSPVSVS